MALIVKASAAILPCDSGVVREGATVGLGAAARRLGSVGAFLGELENGDLASQARRWLSREGGGRGLDGGRAARDAVGSVGRSDGPIRVSALGPLAVLARVGSIVDVALHDETVQLPRMLSGVVSQVPGSIGDNGQLKLAEPFVVPAAAIVPASDSVPHPIVADPVDCHTATSAPSWAVPPGSTFKHQSHVSHPVWPQAHPILSPPVVFTSNNPLQ